MKVNLPVLECLRCGHIWIPRQVEIRICPRCKSPYWDVPPKNKEDKRKEHEKKSES